MSTLSLATHHPPDAANEHHSITFETASTSRQIASGAHADSAVVQGRLRNRILRRSKIVTVIVQRR